MNLVKKFSIFALMIATVFSMSGGVLSVKAAGNYAAGSLLAQSGVSGAAVYYIGSDGMKYVFPDVKTYNSWYENFDNVVRVSVAELDMYADGGAVSVRPGTKLITHENTAKIYAIEPGGVARWIPTAEVAEALYGANWGSRVMDVIPGFFSSSYTAGSDLSNTLPTGTIAMEQGGSTYYYISNGTKRPFSSMDAFEANNFNLDNVLVTSLSSYSAGTSITGEEIALSGYMAAEGGNEVVSGNLTVSLAANTPASTTLVKGQALADLAHFNFSASNAGSVTVRTLKVKRVGVSEDADLTSIYLYDGSNRLTDNVSVSNNYATFNDASGLFTIPAGTTKTISVKANIYSSANAGSTVALEVEAAGDVTSNSSSVGGSFPVMGNTHTIATATLAGVALAGTTYPTASTVDAGETEYTVWKNSVSVTQRSASLEYLRLRNVGSIANNDLQNLKLFVDGVQAGTSQATLDSDGYVTFDLTGSPVTLTTGTRVIEVRADIVGGSSKTFQMSLRYAVDVVVKDTQYNAYVTASGTLPASATSATVNSGSLTVTKMTDSPSGNVQKDASGVTLASYELKAYGESIKIEHLRVTATSTNDQSISQLRNGALFADGVQIGSTADIHIDEAGTDTVTATYTDYNLGSSLIVNPGTPVTLEVKADIYDNDGTNNITAGDYLKVTLSTYTSGAQRMSSLGYIDVPTNSVDGGTVSVVTGSLSVAKNTSYGNQNTIDDLSAYKLGSFIVSATEGEDVNISQFTVGVTYTDTVSDSDTAATTLSDMYLVYGDNTTNPRGTVSASSNNFSVNYVMPNNTQMQVDVYANVNNTPDATDIVSTTLAVSGTTAGSGTNADVTAVSGQTITFQDGSITAAVDPTTAVTDIAIAGGSTTAAKFKLTTQYAPIVLKDFTVKMVTASSSRSVMGAKLDLDNDGIADTPRVSFVYNAATNANYAAFTGLNNNVAANTNKTIGVILDLNDVIDNGTSGDDVKVNFYSYKYSIGGVDTTATPSSLNGNSIYVRNTKPTVTQVSTGGTLTNGAEMDVYKFTVTADQNANVSLKQMKYAATLTDVSTTANTLTLGSWRFFRGSTDITDSVSIENATGTAPVSLKSGGTAFAEGDTTAIVRFSTEEVIEAGASVTYTIKATPSGFTTASDDDYFTIQMSGDASAATAGNVYLQDSDATSSEYIAGLGAGDTDDSVQAANFIWSDNSKVLHNATLADTTSGTSAASTSSGDWTNGYLIKDNLPSNSVQWVY